MSIKAKLAMGIATGALAVSMIGGGTYAYFSDTVESTNSFKAGTLDLELKANNDTTQIISVVDIKPGDTMTKNFKLKNEGSLDIGNIVLETNYTVSDQKNVNDFGQHIGVKFKWGGYEHTTTLAQLKEEKLDIKKLYSQWPGLKYKTGVLDLEVQFEFKENNADQNEFQGDSLQLDWTFNAEQTAGSKK